MDEYNPNNPCVGGAETVDGLAGQASPSPRMISQRECCAQHELRHEAMRYALSAFASAESRIFNADEIVKQAKIFEAFLAGLTPKGDSQ